MLRKSMLFWLVLTLCSLALAQQKTQKEYLAEHSSATGDATTVCNVTFSSGTGSTTTQFCVTVNGNIAQFSINGEEMIQVGVIGEGYGVCDTYSGIAYYDWAYQDSGNWGTPTFTQVGNVITVTRLTIDGIWQLKQTITNIPATATAPGSAKVSMALKNLSAIARNAYLLRYADVDADSITTPNDFDYTSQTAYGLRPGFYRGFGSTNNTFNTAIGQTAFTQNMYIAPNPCNPYLNLAAQPFVGDGSIVQFWYFKATPNTMKTVVSTYKPI